MEDIEEILKVISIRQFETLAQYPSVARRLIHSIKRAIEADSVEDVNEVGLNCRELLNDYARQIFSPDFSQQEVKNGDTKDLLKETITFYTKSGSERSTIQSLNNLVNHVVRELNRVTHSSNIYPEQAFLCINLCISLITSIETLIILNEKAESPMYEYFGILKCPECKSLKISGFSIQDEEHDEMYYIVQCDECGWMSNTQ